MVRARYVLPVIAPALLLAIPTVAYIIDSRTGVIPSQAEWQSAAHSSGPWMGSWVQTVCFLFGIGGLLITGCGAAVSVVNGRGIQFWVAQGIGILVADAFIFYFFGWLFD